MDPEGLQAKLRDTFLAELEEHVRALTTDLLALERTGPAERPELLQRLFRTVHSVKGSSRAASVELIEAAAARMERLLADAREEPGREARPLVDVLLETVDAIEEAGQRLRERRALEGGRLAGLLPPATPGAGPAPAAPAAPGSIRLGTDRLDRLQALEAELRAARHGGEALREQLASLQESTRRWAAEWENEAGALRGASAHGAAAAVRERGRIARLAADLERLGGEATAGGRRIAQAADPLADELRALRMVPFADACAGLDRAVRDLARTTGKEAELVVSGAEVALDRAVAEALRAPLLHLVRNAVDHGLEPAAERAARGKPPAGRVALAAVLRGGEIEIAVEDDGRGLDLDAIRARARERGLPDEPDPRALARLVFAAGFTTARLVTDVSGRGVGLDAVRAAVEGLQGSVDVAPRPAGGTRFVLVVPLTLVALRALLVSAAGETFAIPASHLRRVLAVHREDVALHGGREVIRVDGAPVPIVPLADALGLPAAGVAPRPAHDERGAAGAGRPDALQVAVVAAAGRPVALAVDGMLAEREIQIRALGARVRRLRHLAGAALLPDGGVALILHVPAVVETALGRGAAGLSRAREAPQRKRRVLLVDDSPTTRTLERSILEAAGYAVATAADGEEAWAILEREGADALVADVEMPRLDGFGLTAAVRASKRLEALPVVLVTAREAEADRAHGLAVGANAYLVKSTFDQRSLLETLEQLLG